MLPGDSLYYTKTPKLTMNVIFTEQVLPLQPRPNMAFCCVLHCPPKNCKQHIIEPHCRLDDCSLITMDASAAVCFDSIPHTRCLAAVSTYSHIKSAAQHSRQQMLYLVMFEQCLLKKKVQVLRDNFYTNGRGQCCRGAGEVTKCFYCLFLFLFFIA